MTAEGTRRKPTLILEPEALPSRVSVPLTTSPASPSDALQDRPFLRALDRHERIRPGFARTWVEPSPPEGVRERATYLLPGCTIRLLQVPGEEEGVYHLDPEEYALSKEELAILRAAHDALLDEMPDRVDFPTPQQAREYVSRRGLALLTDLQHRSGVALPGAPVEVRARLDRLARVLARYTVGYGVLEILLLDPRVQDIYINAPTSTNPVRLNIGTRDVPGFPARCRTNVLLSRDDEEILLSRLRAESGRPFSEAFPVLEADMSAFGTRATAVGPPLSPHGIAFALRRHSPEPWTLLRLIDADALSPLAAALLSTLVQGQATLIVAGGRGAGKTSLLSAMLLEIPLGNRILTIEDTAEIPVAEMQQIGYQVQALGVQSALGGRLQMTTEDALRVALRLGESAIVLGEVRGTEAKTLYESMRAGTAGSAVLGTFHADTAEAVFNRAVHDIGIAPNAFQATDAVVIPGAVRHGNSLTTERKLIQLAEFDKTEPERGVFHDIIRYRVSDREWVATERLQRGSSVLARIGAKSGLDYYTTLRAVEAKATILNHIVTRARTMQRPDLLGARMVPRYNARLKQLLSNASDGKLDGEVEAFARWFEGAKAVR